MQIRGFHDDVSKVERLLEEQINEATANEDADRVESLTLLKEAIQDGLTLVLQQAGDYLALFGFAVKTRTTFYKITERVYSIPYNDMNPGGSYRTRLYDRKVLDLFIQHREAFENTREEVAILEKLNNGVKAAKKAKDSDKHRELRNEFIELSKKLARQKLAKLREQLSEQDQK